MKNQLTLVLSLIAMVTFTLAPTVRAEGTLSPAFKTTEGKIVGQVEGNVISFRGIPYAQPPVGALRWEKPVRPAVRSQTFSALTYGTACTQKETSKEGVVKIIGAEDCLYLNIWRPKSISSPGKLPVMFWIHGGGFVQGTTSGYNPFAGLRAAQDLDLYDGKALVERENIILVNFNYRLGAFGFFAKDGLSSTGSSANAGLHDILSALQWVRANIANFGGDPQNIMVFGESAGAYGTCALLTSPLAQGLFAKAAMQSEYCVSRPLADAKALSQQTTTTLRCQGTNEVACLRSKSTSEIALAQFSEQLEGGLPGSTGLAYVPVVDGIFLKEKPTTAISAGRYNKVPMILGGTSEESGMMRLSEGTVPKTFAEIGAMIRQIAALSSEEQDRLITLYGPQNYRKPQGAFISLTSDIFMTCPQRHLAQTLIAAGTPSLHRYVFDAGVPGFMGLMKALVGAFHGSELFFLFQNLEQMPFANPGKLELALEESMGAYWTAFAKQSNPNRSGYPTWPVYTPNQRETLHLTYQTRDLNGYHEEECDLIGKGLPQTLDP